MDEYYRDDFNRKHLRRQSLRVDFERPGRQFNRCNPELATTREQMILASHWKRFGGTK